MSQTSTSNGFGGSGGNNDEDLTCVMVATGNEVGLDQEKTLLRAFVKSVLWRNVKFLQPEDLLVDAIVSRKCRKRLNYKKKNWGPAWENWAKREVSKAVNEKRNNVAQSIGIQETKSKYKESHVCQTKHRLTLDAIVSFLPSLSASEELRGGTSSIGGNDVMLKKMIRDKRKNPETYAYYMDHGVKYVSGAAGWKKFVESGKEQPMGIATPSDEALTLLLYENYNDKWIDEHNNKETVRRAKYTQQDGSRYGEWSDEGIERFNQLVQEVKEDRESQRGKRTEENYQLHKISTACPGRRKRRKVTPDSKVRVVNDLNEDTDDSSDSDDSDSDS